MNTALRSFSAAVLLALGLPPMTLAQSAPDPFVQEEPQEEKKAKPEADRDLESLRADLKRLREEERRLRERIEDLQRSIEGRRAEGEKKPTRREPFRWIIPAPGRNGFRFDFGPWEEELREWSERFPGAWRFQDGRSESLTLRHDQSGVKVEVRRRDEGGEETVDTYEAKSPEEFLEKHPEIAERYGLSFGEGGSFHLQVRPSLRFGPDHWPEIRGFDVPLLPRSGDHLGVYVEPLDADRARELGLKKGEGLVVREVNDDTLAAEMGIEAGDVLVQINGRRITGSDTVRSAVRQTKAGGEVNVEIRRDGETMTLSAKKPGAKPLKKSA